MLGVWTRRTVGILVVAAGVVVVSSTSEASDETAAAIQRAVKLLPKQPFQVAVIDADEAKDEARAILLKLDAFVVKGSQVVYLTKHSAVLQGASQGSALHTHMLASIIWHEMAHAEGADEPEAQRREQALWMQFLRDGKVDTMIALRYADLLANRHRSASRPR
jgi:hypothetical protein